MSYPLLIILFLLNGIVFSPPSEYLYYVVYITYDASVAHFIIFALVNSIGHILLYYLSIFVESRLLGYEFPGKPLYMKIKGLASVYLFDNFPPFFSILLARCIPGVKTGISIIAGVARVNLGVFISATLIGNIIFALFNYFIISFLPQNDHFIAIAVLTLFIFVSYIVHYWIHKKFFTKKY